MIRLTLLAALIGIVLAIKFLPWYATVGIVVAMFFALKFFGLKALEKALTKPFRMKGAVLHDATAEVHGISPAPAPTPEEDADEFDDDFEDEDAVDLGALEHFYIDVTITPNAPTGPFQHWEAGELMLVAPGSDPEDLDDEDETCVVHDYMTFEDGEFVVDEVYKFEGPQRIRLHVGMKPGTKHLEFRYYFELFGSVDFSRVALAA